MEQADLRRLESQCVQEETPQCVAACPLHVDAKQFCKLMAQRRIDKAWQVLAKTMPLPGVLARMCGEPCKAACVRQDVGGPINMGTMERYCAENAKPINPPKPLPARNKSVGVVGGGFTGLCAAWELARRGFETTLYCSQLGEGLPPFPEGVLDRELTGLETMGVKIETGFDASVSFIRTLIGDMDAVFVDSDVLPESVRDFGAPDELTLGTQEHGLFVSLQGEDSAILQAATGRRAANSIERFTQGVSMVTGRELEGPYETRLYTNLDNVQSLTSALPERDCSELDVRDEAKRCLQCECMECVKSCEYLRHYKFYPKVYARQIYNNESIVMGTRQANTMINSCMLCGLCETVCPEDFSMADVCLEARRTMVEGDKMPPSAHEFALRDMAFANGEKCSLAKHAPGTDTSDYLFFPGCQLTASDPSGVEAAYADLRNRLGNVGLMLHCCGAPAEWSGRVVLERDSMNDLKQIWESLGAPKIIAACPTCLKSLRAGLPNAEITSHWSLLRVLGIREDSVSPKGPFAINDPCAARHDVVLREDIRSILDTLGADTVEPELSGETTQCCGYGGLLSEANPALGMHVAAKRAEAREEDYVTYCVMCRDMMAKTGKRALHLYDLLYSEVNDPAARPSPGYSERRENRVRLKEHLLRNLWREEPNSVAELFESIDVSFTDEALQRMEQRRILKSDVQKTLLAVRESGKRFVHAETGHYLTSHRPVIVTYWVEYEEQGKSYLVHNVWSHRMHIKGVKS
ncbi:pyridine nucleotide-disulfide oxidoreductase/dicluster-binding protein [Pseudodesulfovibrio sp. zrk46]|uniref:pyridine nucleotide-disulfide oxidoreductase/dicluster-binding protein n=1 Tax=Pseudodesulfovibrio sp. zrk46 TaxID=2725288 RepID=UPI001FFC6286|nr:pyridine nucleotide-disulfide oxidoreductase/dicluster-binding protein [Pseudodesulfovibrio sp. zrk46]